MKCVIFVRADHGEECRVCWYAGTSDQMVEKATRLMLRIPPEMNFLLRDSAGDLVPVSGVLPSHCHYDLVLQENLPQPEPPKQTESQVNSDSVSLRTSGSSTTRKSTSSSPQQRKRPRPEGPTSSSDSISAVQASNPVDLSDVTTHVTSSGVDRPLQEASNDTGHGTIVHQPSMASSRAVSSLISSFVETFTQAITTDDNVNFIPCSGRFSLFSVFCQVIPLPHFHPKTPEAFYKIASMQCKLDRQRIVRYYRVQQDPKHADSEANGSHDGLDSSNDTSRVSDSSRSQVFQYKPHGKGPYLRKYVAVPSASTRTFHQMIKKAAFLKSIGIAPRTALEIFALQVQSFQPISKSDFKTSLNFSIATAT